MSDPTISKYYNMFKAYDLRGTYPEINEIVFYWAAYGLVTEILKPENLPLKVVVTHDCRYTSPKFYQAVCNGVKDAGGEPVMLGVGSTDFLYAASQVLGLPGAQITASHNPKDDNGMKIVKQVPQMLGLSTGLDKVRDFVITKIDIVDVDQSKWFTPSEDTTIKSTVWDYYKTKLQEIGKIKEVDELLVEQGRKLKIVVDTGNGMGGFIMEEMVKLYKNIEFIPLYWELDGNFPNHPADPQTRANMVDLQRTLLAEKADFGFAFDGDADRVFFVDESGELVQGDFLVALFAETLLKDYHISPDPKFDAAVVCLQPGSRCVAETVAEHDGVAIPSKQGHTFMKEKMSHYKAIYGGEFSGHHYFGNFAYMDAGSLAAVLLIKVAIEKNAPLSTLFTKLTKSYFISDLMNLKIPEGQTFEDFKVKLQLHFPEATFSELDGLSAYYPDWKFSMRPSNTEPLVRFILETRWHDQVTEKVAEVKKVVGVE